MNAFTTITEAKNYWNERLKGSNIKLMRGNNLQKNNQVYGQYLWCNNKCGFRLTVAQSLLNGSSLYSIDDKSMEILNSFTEDKVIHDCNSYLKIKNRSGINFSC